VSYAVKLRSTAQKDLDALTGQEYESVARAISNLEKNPRPTKVKKLAESGLWRIRVKKCRLVYAINDTTKVIIVVRVARRREDTYKRL